MNVTIESFPSPIGIIEVASTSSGELAGIWVRTEVSGRHFEERLRKQGFHAVRSDGDAWEVRTQFDDWFAGRRTGFDLSLLLQGTGFERAVWRELRFIPYGETITYGELASAVGFAGEAQRAGAACAANPWLIVVPCHRVVASDGALRGYAAGLHVKERLLALERGQPALAF